MLVKLKGYDKQSLHFHSLLAETERGGLIERFREFVIFDAALAYPEFLLAYRRCSKSTPAELPPLGPTPVASPALMVQRSPKPTGEMQGRLEPEPEPEPACSGH
jgi:hypothetical protein